MSTRHAQACHDVNYLRRLVSLTAVIGVAMLIAASTASATVAPTTTYTSQQTFPVPPASNYAGSGGGDGWAVALSNTQVFNVFHHDNPLHVVAHNQSDASTAWGPSTITDTNGNTFATGGQVGLYLDQKTGKLYVYATRTSDSTGGVVCIDTTQGATNPDPFCGFTALTGAGEASLWPGWGELTNATLIGNHLYSFNWDPGSGVGPGAQNKVLCFDVSTDAACANQPFTVNFAAGSMDYFGPSLGMVAVAGKLIMQVSVGGNGQLACFNDATQADCGASWPASAPQVENQGGAPFALLDGSGNPIGVCLPTGGIPCWDLNGNPVATPAGLPGALSYGTAVNWDGPGYALGTRVYIPQWGNVVACFDYATGASCANFPKFFSGLDLLYSVSPDPQRPTCLWVNSNDGGSQIQNFDAYSGGACGEGGIRVLASQFIVNKPACYPVTYQSLQVNYPDPSTYSGGTVQVEDADGNPIGSPVPLDASGKADLTTVNNGNLNTNGLPQFVITLNGETGNPTHLTATLTYTAPYDPSCAMSGVTPTPTPTTTTTNLSGGGQSGTSITVPSGTAVSDQATVSGNDAGQATGSVTYTVYSDSSCKTQVATNTQSISSPGSVPASSPVSLTTPGTYYWVASYSGDPGNNPSSSSCGAEVETVTATNGPCTMTAGANTAFNGTGGQSVHIENALSTNLSAPQMLVLRSLSGTPDFFKLTRATTVLCVANPNYPIGEDGPHNKLTLVGTGSFGTSSTTAQPGYFIQIQIGDYGDSGSTDNTAADAVTIIVKNSQNQIVWQSTGTLGSGSEEISG